MALVAPFSGAASDRFGPRVLASAGMAIMALGLLSLTQLPTDFALPDLIWRLVVLGIGQGLFMSPNSSAVLGCRPPRASRDRVRHAGPDAGQRPGPRDRLERRDRGHRGCRSIWRPRCGDFHASSQSVAQAGAIHDAFVVAALVCSVGIVTSLGSWVEPARAPQRPRLRMPRDRPAARARALDCGVDMSLSRLAAASIRDGSASLRGRSTAMPAAVQRDFAARDGAARLRHPLVRRGLGQEAFARGAIYLAATERLVVASGIANIWARDAAAMANGGRTLAEAWPGRFILGLGVIIFGE